MKNIVFISSIKWDYAWHRQQEICSKLAEADYKILFVEPNSKKRKSEVLRRVLPNVWVLNPNGLPYERCLYSINYINSFIAKRAIARAMKQLNMKSVIIMFDRVHGVDLKYYCDHYKTIYDLVDEITAFGRIKNKHMLIGIENYMLRNADLVTSSSQTLLDRKIKQSKRTGQSIFIPNGVDVERFKTEERWQKIENIGSPIIGFVGTISERSLDYGLIKSVVKYNRNWQFVFVGPGKEEDKAKLIDKNVHIFEQVTGEMIPKVINSFDVTIIPYNTKGVSMDYVFPRKACEYLAAGKPVISTAMCEVLGMQPYVQIIYNSDEFIKAVENALNDKQTEKRREFAEKYDWKTLLGDLEVEIARL